MLCVCLPYYYYYYADGWMDDVVDVLVGCWLYPSERRLFLEAFQAVVRWRQRQSHFILTLTISPSHLVKTHARVGISIFIYLFIKEIEIEIII